MSTFKNPFQDDDHVINLTEDTPVVQENTKQKNKNKSKSKKHKQKQKNQNNVPETSIESLENSMIVLTTPRQEGMIQPQPYDAQQTIFMRKGDTFGNKNSGPLEDDDPPLLQDIGIDLSLVGDKILSIVKFQKPIIRYIEQPDLFGPIIIGFTFGLLLLLSGKIHFGDIYAMFVIGNILMFLLFNLMSKNEILSLYSIMSSLGYCLLPLLLVGLFGIIFPLKNTFGILLSMILSGWCAFSASGYIEMQINSLEQDRRALIMYPLYLYYVSFAMITIF